MNKRDSVYDVVIKKKPTQKLTIVLFVIIAVLLAVSIGLLVEFLKVKNKNKGLLN